MFRTNSYSCKVYVMLIGLYPCSIDVKNMGCVSIITPNNQRLHV